MREVCYSVGYDKTLLVTICAGNRHLWSISFVVGTRDTEMNGIRPQLPRSLEFSRGITGVSK